MENNYQGENRIVISAAKEQIWKILENASLLPKWIPMVDSLSQCSEGKEEVGATRTCEVNMNGRKGSVVERCVECVPNQKISYVVVEDTLGFSKMVSGFGFSFFLEPKTNKSTEVILRGYYEPKGLFGRIMNTLMLRKNLSQARDKILNGLKNIVEKAEVSNPAAETV